MKRVHKFYRRFIDKAQFRLCDSVRCDYAENVSFRWAKVDCPKCKKLKGFRRG